MVQWNGITVGAAGRRPASRLLRNLNLAEPLGALSGLFAEAATAAAAVRATILVQAIRGTTRAGIGEADGRFLAEAATAAATVGAALLVQAIRGTTRAGIGEADGRFLTEAATAAATVGAALLVQAIRGTTGAGVGQTDLFVLADAAEGIARVGTAFFAVTLGNAVYALAQIAELVLQ